MKGKLLFILLLFTFVLFGVTERPQLYASDPIEWEEEEGSGGEIEPECDLCRVTYLGKVRFGCKPDPDKSCSGSAGGATVSCHNAKQC